MAPEMRKRKETWKMIAKELCSVKLPVLILRDLNQVLAEDDKLCTNFGCPVGMDWLVILWQSLHCKMLLPRG